MATYCNNCCCCGYYLVPRYKRLINNIFSQDPEHGIDKNSLERLRFYAVRKPEKIDKSFRYMSEKIAHYLHNRNRPYVILGLTAMNDTMKSCSQQLNIFVDYYLETLYRVLEESNDLEINEQAVASFESFCETREEAPNYQRNYDFFVDRFTQFCYSNDQINEKKVRCLGLRGHHALILKTATDELQNDVWKHIDQIVPSIIFNLEVPRKDRRQETLTTEISTVKTVKDDPSLLAPIVLKDLLYRAHGINMSASIESILTHLDDHEKWIPDDFPRYIFSEIMNSIKHHNSYVIIELLLNHLDKHFDKTSTTNVRTSIMNVIHDCLVFSVTNNEAGAIMFPGISNLLKFLNKSLYLENKRDGISSNNGDEKQFQTAIINTIRDFAENLADFQMMEVIQSITITLSTYDQKSKGATNESKAIHLKFQLIVLRTMEKIAIKVQSMQHDDATRTQTLFPHQLFDPLIKTMSSSESEIRLIVLEILRLLIDRRHLGDKFRKIRLSNDISHLYSLNDMKQIRFFDIPFMKKFGRRFLSQLYQCILINNNTKDIFYTIYCVMILVTLETNDRDVFVDVVHFCFEIQSTITKLINEESKPLSKINYYRIHALIAAYFNLTSKLYQIDEFSHHVDEIIHNRQLRAPYSLPPMAYQSITEENLSKRIPKDCLFSQEIIQNALKSSNYDTSRVNRLISIESDLEVASNRDSDEFELSISSQIDLRTGYSHIENKSNQKNPFDIEEQTSSDDNRQMAIEFSTKPFADLNQMAKEQRKQMDKRIEQILNVRYLPNDEIPIKFPNGRTNSDDQKKSSDDQFTYPESFIY